MNEWRNQTRCNGLDVYVPPLNSYVEIPSPDTKSPGIFVLDFLAFRIVR